MFTGSVEHAIAHIEESIQGKVDDQYLRWYAIKVFERDEKVLDSLTLTKDLEAHLEAHIADCENELEDDAESIITNQRYAYINSVVNRAVKKKAPKHSLTTSDKIDRIVTNRVLALPIFVAVMFLIYAIAMGGWAISIGTAATDFTNDTIFGEWVPGFFDSFLLNASGEPVVADWLYGLIQDGIVAGVGAVLGFVPQMLVLFVLLAVLEDVGYMARIAFIMDRIFRRFGLSGKSFIPMLVATGCGVPGIMASRTIEQDRDRKMTVMTTGFIPCGAKMPIIGLFAGAVFGNSAWVATSAYFIGVAAVIISGIMLKKFKAFAGEPAPFVMELPTYHAPSAGNVLRATWERGWSFIKRAGTVILVSSIILWFLQGYGFVDGVFQAVEDNNDSLLAVIGNAIAWIFYPLGWTGSMAWKAAVATLTGLIAKEEVVSTFGVLYHYAGDIDLMEDSSPIWAMVGAGLRRHFRLLLHDLQPAVRPLFCRHGRHQAGDEQRQVDSGRHRLHVRVRLCDCHDRLSDRRSVAVRHVLRPLPAPEDRVLAVSELQDVLVHQEADAVLDLPLTQGGQGSIGPLPLQPVTADLLVLPRRTALRRSVRRRTAGRSPPHSGGWPGRPPPHRSPGNCGGSCSRRRSSPEPTGRNSSGYTDAGTAGCGSRTSSASDDPSPLLELPRRLRVQLLAGLALADEELGCAHVLPAVQQDTSGLRPVPACPARLLVVALQILGHVVMDHIADVGLVDAHAEGVGGHHHLDPVEEEVLLILPPLLRLQPGVVAGCGDAGALEELADLLHVLPGGAVDDAALPGRSAPGPAAPPALRRGGTPPDTGCPGQTRW